ncbi:hypothetical protein FRX31_031051, partial [Thalictrum thalictroides]
KFKGEVLDESHKDNFMLELNVQTSVTNSTSSKSIGKEVMSLMQHGSYSTPVLKELKENKIAPELYSYGS